MHFFKSDPIVMFGYTASVRIAGVCCTLLRVAGSNPTIVCQWANGPKRRTTYFFPSNIREFHAMMKLLRLPRDFGDHHRQGQ